MKKRSTPSSFNIALTSSSQASVMSVILLMIISVFIVYGRYSNVLNSRSILCVTVSDSSMKPSSAMMWGIT